MLRRSSAPCPTTWSRWAAPSGSAPTARSRISRPSPQGPIALRNALRDGDFDVVHVHEPAAPTVGWDACSWREAPVVGTFHAYSTKAFPNHVATLLGARRKFNQLSGRIAVSQAAAWTARRWFGGEYTIVPNGVDIANAPQGPKTASDKFRIAFVGRAEERKGLPVLLNAFEALVEHVPATLTVVGADADEVATLPPGPGDGPAHRHRRQDLRRPALA